jgi:hypothetical protein
MEALSAQILRSRENYRENLKLLAAAVAGFIHKAKPFR